MIDRLFYEELRQHSEKFEFEKEWPLEQLDLCREFDVFSQIDPGETSKTAQEEWDIVQIYIDISRNCLKTAFILTQRNAALSRINDSDNHHVRSHWQEKIQNGEVFATVGISHLTTSAQHLSTPVVRARFVHQGAGILLDGEIPWVTGAPHSDLLVAGGTLDDGKQVLVAVATKFPGVRVGKGLELLGLEGTKTDRVQLENVLVSAQQIIAGPVEQVMKATAKGTGGAGGVLTSALAIGLSLRIQEYLVEQLDAREELSEVVSQFATELDQLLTKLRSLVLGNELKENSESIRQSANSLVLRIAQAAMTTAKGAGYVTGHGVERWCRESLFFLVWSCPRSVALANLCEFSATRS